MIQNLPATNKKNDTEITSNKQTDDMETTSNRYGMLESYKVKCGWHERRNEEVLAGVTINIKPVIYIYI